MPEKSTFIKIDRNITEWGWYQNGNTFRVFLHILLKANIKDKKFEKITIHRGELAVSIDSLSNALGLSFQQIRTALEHLKSTGEITITRHSKFQVISIKNYDFYQSNYENQQSNNNQITINQQSDNNQITTTKEYKESKEKKECKENSNKPKSETEKIIDAYNEICKSLPKVRKPISEDRKKHIQARINAGYTVEDFTEAFRKAEASSFCRGEKSTGNHKNWRATFDWIITDKFLPRILEGAYDDKGVNTNGKTVYRDTGII